MNTSLNPIEPASLFAVGTGAVGDAVELVELLLEEVDVVKELEDVSVLEVVDDDAVEDEVAFDRLVLPLDSTDEAAEDTLDPADETAKDVLDAPLSTADEAVLAGDEVLDTALPVPEAATLPDADADADADPEAVAVAAEAALFALISELKAEWNTDSAFSGELD